MPKIICDVSAAFCCFHQAMIQKLIIIHSNLIFVSLPDESSRKLLKRHILFFGLTDADMRETENAK